jgi:multidrug efflux pump subunit AcrA (membrane-fusion protein)
VAQTDSSGSEIVIERVMGVQPADPSDESSGLLVPESAIVREQNRSFVWALTPIDVDRSTQAPAYRASRVAVKPGPERRMYRESVVLRPLSQNADLSAYQLLAVDGKEAIRDGGTVRVTRTTWALRPGDIVRVDLDSDPEPPGVFAPIRSIRRQDAERGVVFLADEGVASAVEVRLGEVRGSRQRITSTGDSSLVGDSLIVRGVEYLQDGDPVRVVSEIDQSSDDASSSADATTGAAEGDR